ncbi:MAG: hypothetical protein NTV12_03255 [Verrucomicrobia bacterium]|nr:hypothetical protein [Verrucomicrobiota bacterium]
MPGTSGGDLAPDWSLDTEPLLRKRLSTQSPALPLVVRLECMHRAQ